ncbi:hypothetical protein CLF_107162 [Clonorchis sinensis]|uniref:Uncharacterized protein n=1 Tax=Clonorchis sinensis TaxID=79923 RepID=G7YG93_CLOSI|nr:hypothetical protein CLF_107162 [Clonorchis sinensis]
MPMFEVSAQFGNPGLGNMVVNTTQSLHTGASLKPDARQGINDHTSTGDEPQVQIRTIRVVCATLKNGKMDYRRRVADRHFVLDVSSPCLNGGQVFSSFPRSAYSVAVVKRSLRMSDVRGSNPGTVIGYALLMSSNKRETRVQCFSPFAFPKSIVHPPIHVFFVVREDSHKSVLARDPLTPRLNQLGMCESSTDNFLSSLAAARTHSIDI